ncbi:wax ester/triacylglycerol synthase domain-containing protein [Microlunatus sp. GCM10028923]|uniref:wax ester/triacylglycerol synthase domain-containing protein n=1 Tax=Microlunatus sp. GCM10028923 TaxID=3273400 RepID=UPI0036209871
MPAHSGQISGTRGHAEPVLDRASATDRAFLAIDRGRTPKNFGVLLIFEADGFDLGSAQQLMAERVAGIPRLRQRLIKTPAGCGGPIWVDDDAFELGRHLRLVRCPEPADDQALLDAAYQVVRTPMPRDRPLWSGAFITGLAGGRTALVIALHHALTDGVGGLGILTELADPGAAGPDRGFPRPRPSRARLARAAWSELIKKVGESGHRLRLLRASVASSGGAVPPPAAACSLVGPTGGRGRLAVVRIPRAPLRAAAHRQGATTNDAILVAVAALFERLLRSSGEKLDTLRIGVPVSGRPVGESSAGNQVSPMLVGVPTHGDLAARLRQVAAITRARKPGAQGPPPMALLGWVFRLLAAAGWFRWYLNHQRRMHTLVSSIRGPAEPITFGGVPIQVAIPVGVADDGNQSLGFIVLSYAGTLTISVIMDPRRFPDPAVVVDALTTELAMIMVPESVPDSAAY